MSAVVVSRSHSGPADGETVAHMRNRVRDWLSCTVDVDAQRVCDIVLAVGEALANSAEHAYRDHAVTGTMTLTIVYDSGRAAVELIVGDDGTWIEPSDSASVSSFRGRGLRLIRALSDDCRVQGHPGGTTVRMQFLQCPPRDESATKAS
ncbi:ATP-binding protein [Candidatus Mycobacterium wuenschmannii]|uniref:ATP-binding protein n=1 Tax=Candidatus Mycobacterium wuenschmannii TaxID=3027808 RepID=A0ABY8W475_9MYCO|nr:ATP-binding protein [Candidatus Mycobacterium wuenschmannii]WIM89832.1 ATP-binding protein [Candidatus Mycobacterium wuenschmannii]